MLRSGAYTITNKSTGLCLESPPPNAKQLSQAHPRASMTPSSILHGGGANKEWFIEEVGNGRYLIKNIHNMALDSNENVPQQDHSHSMPFLYSASSTSPNHRWIIEFSGEPDTFFILSEYNGKALDGNVDGAQQTDYANKAPFLWPLNRQAQNHKWIISPVRGQYNPPSYPPSYPQTNYPSGGDDIHPSAPPTQHSSGGSNNPNWSSGGGY